MAIPYEVREQFNVLQDAAEHDALAVVEVTDKETGEPAYVLCWMRVGGESVDLVPLGQMLSGDPFIRFEPPLGAEVYYGESGQEAP